MLTLEKSIGTTNGAPCVASGQTIKAEPAPSYVDQLRSHIRNLTPFECSDWDALCTALLEEYDAETWRVSLVWLLASVRTLKQFEKEVGSWNVPVRAVENYQNERECYKVFRRHTVLKDEHLVEEFKYEWHQSAVVPNTWLKAEISGSPGLSGISSPEGAKFHCLYDKDQAEAYLYTRVVSHNTSWFTAPEAVIKKVTGRNFYSIDLVYAPPNQWVWGIDAREMYVHL